MSGKTYRFRGPASLTPAEVVDLRQRYRDGYSATVLADRFGLDSRYVSRVNSGELRSDVLVDVPAWTPLCMDAADFRLWSESRVGSNFNTATPRPCDDCPLAFAADMRQLGLCNGTPGDVAWEPEAVA